MLRQFVNTGFQVLFHSPPGVLFTFPSQYYALSVTKEYLALRGGPRFFHQGSTCLDVLWIPPCWSSFRLRGFHPLWPAFPKPFHYKSQITSAVRTPECTHSGLGFTGLIPGLGRSPGEGNGNPLQYSWLENPMDRGAWQATVHGVTKSWTPLGD